MNFLICAIIFYMRGLSRHWWDISALAYRVCIKMLVNPIRHRDPPADKAIRLL